MQKKDVMIYLYMIMFLGGAGHVKQLVDKQVIVESLKAALEKVSQNCCDENTSCYNMHTADFVNTTQNVDFCEIQELFLSFLPVKAKILDFGCGSGRDTKYFIDNGYEVDAMDGSRELCMASGT